MTSVPRPNHPSFSADGIVRIPLAHGRVALVDVTDYPLICEYRWHATFRGSRCYAVAHIPGSGHDGQKVLLHRLIMDAQPGEIIDHISGDCCDNRRSNLRRATGTQNNANVRKHLGVTSRYKGVSQEQRCHRWVAKIHNRGQAFHLGTYHTEDDAARGYDLAAISLWREYALTNFPASRYTPDEIAMMTATLSAKTRNAAQ
jgi:hypothetical protein